MPFTQPVNGNMPLFGFDSSAFQPKGGTPALTDDKKIVIPFKPMAKEDADVIEKQRAADYEKNMNKLYAQAEKAGVPKEVTQMLLAKAYEHNLPMANIKINKNNHSISIDMGNKNLKLQYNNNLLRKRTVITKDKKYVEEFKDGNRIFTEYSKDISGNFVKKYYEKSTETDYKNLTERHIY